jgi:hypothetical protein
VDLGILADVHAAVAGTPLSYAAWVIHFEQPLVPIKPLPETYLQTLETDSFTASELLMADLLIIIIILSPSDGDDNVTNASHQSAHAATGGAVARCYLPRPFLLRLLLLLCCCCCCCCCCCAGRDIH